MKRGARLSDDRAAVEEWFRAGDGNIRKARLCITWHVERERHDAVRQRTDPRRPVGIEFELGYVGPLDDRTAAPVELDAANHRRGDRLTSWRDDPNAEIGCRLETDHR